METGPGSPRSAPPGSGESQDAHSVDPRQHQQQPRYAGVPEGHAQQSPTFLAGQYGQQVGMAHHQGQQPQYHGQPSVGFGGYYQMQGQGGYPSPGYPTGGHPHMAQRSGLAMPQGGHMPQQGYYPPQQHMQYGHVDPRFASGQGQAAGGPVPTAQWRHMQQAAASGGSMDQALLNAATMADRGGAVGGMRQHQAYLSQPGRAAPPLPVELHPLTKWDLKVLAGAADPAMKPPPGCVSIRQTKQTGHPVTRCAKAFGLSEYGLWCAACRRHQEKLVAAEGGEAGSAAYAEDAAYDSEPAPAPTMVASVVRTPKLEPRVVQPKQAPTVAPPQVDDDYRGESDRDDDETADDEDVGPSQGQSAADADSSGVDSKGNKLPPGRRRKHVCTAACNHVCATEGCYETLTAAAARSRYIRCAKCRRNGFKTVVNVVRKRGAEDDAAEFDSGGNDADQDQEIDEVISRRKRHATGKGKGIRADASAAPAEGLFRLKAASPELTVSQKGRVRMPAKIYSPSQSPAVQQPPNRFSFDVDQNSTLLETPKRKARELSKGSPRLGGLWSPRSADSPIFDEDESMYSERLEPRVYISPSPNWFVRPPVGADPSLVARLISAYRSDKLEQKRIADAQRVASAELTPAKPAGPPPPEPATPPHQVAPAFGEPPLPIEMEIVPIALGNDEPNSWLPSSRTSSAVSPIQMGSAASLDDESERSASVTIGLPNDDEDDDMDDDGMGSHDSDVPAQLRLAVESNACEGTGTFDPAKCRKCQISDEDDMEDLIMCTVCSITFHAGCEEPPMDWTPSEAFCSIICFENFKVSAPGIELFKKNMMLTKGHLREYGNCLNNDAIASILELTSPLYYSGDAIRIPSAEWLRPGQCISMRAEPHVDDPRTEWPAVVRHVYHHRSGYPLYFVTWLDPIRPDKAYYKDMPCGIPQLVSCPSISCPTRRGYSNHHGYQCYSSTCRQRSAFNGYSQERHSPKIEELDDNEPADLREMSSSAPPPTIVPQPLKGPSRLRIALSATDLDGNAPAASARAVPVTAVTQPAAVAAPVASVPPVKEPLVVRPASSFRAVASPTIEVKVAVATAAAVVAQPTPVAVDARSAEPRSTPLSVASRSSSRDDRVTPSVSPEELAVSAHGAAEAVAAAALLASATSGDDPRRNLAARAPLAGYSGGMSGVARSGGSAWSSAAVGDNGPRIGAMDTANVEQARRVGDRAAMDVESAGSAADDQDQDLSRQSSPPLRQFMAPSDLTLPYQMQPGGFALRRDAGADFSRQSADSDGTVTGDESVADTLTDGDTEAEDTDEQYWDSRQQSIKALRDSMDEQDYDSDRSGIDSDRSGVSVASSAVSTTVPSATAGPAMAVDAPAGSTPAPAPRPRKRKRASKPENLTKDEMEEKYGKRAIMCTCGRVFSNGQALGGHRGKCKVPRERAKALAAGGLLGALNSDSDEPGVRVAKKPRSRPKPDPIEKAERERRKAESRERKAQEKAAVKAAAREARHREKAAARAERADRGEELERIESEHQRQSRKNRRRPPIPVVTAPQPKIHPVFPIRPFHPDNYKLGRNERRPQVPAAVVKIHPFMFPDLPPNFFSIHKDFAKHKHTLAKLDELNPATDAQLYGPVDEPELNTNAGFLEFGREAPRKLAFVAPGVKMREDRKVDLGRTRSQTPNSDIGGAAPAPAPAASAPAQAPPTTEP